jgi:hypothetical protein
LELGFGFNDRALSYIAEFYCDECADIAISANNEICYELCEKLIECNNEKGLKHVIKYVIPIKGRFTNLYFQAMTYCPEKY